MIGLLLIDHGSRRDEANEMLWHVATLVEQLAGGDVVVCPAHMELAEPTIAQGFAQCVARGATEVVAVPYMLSPGRHSTNDIPKFVEQAAREFPGTSYRVAEPLGIDARLAEVVLTRAGVDNVEAIQCCRPSQQSC